jgi:dGTPase
MLTRQELERREHLLLSDAAAFSDASKGRLRAEEPCPLRTAFVRDRDRIIHCKSFRRLKHKTQVFLSPEGDHYRTRLTHTLEVSQIARTIARALLLNEDLTEAICMGHDLGHTPFGHSGEQVLNELSSTGFTHYEQSLRVVDTLEKEGEGLNLTHEVRDGILWHSLQDKAQTAEGRLVYWADHIAYVNHDIDDAIRAQVLRKEELPESVQRVLGDRHSVRINTMIFNMIENGETGGIGLTGEVLEAYETLHDFLFERVYLNPVAKAEEGRAKQAMTMLFEFFLKQPDRLPPEYIRRTERDTVERVVLDYISGMTDRYCIATFEQLFVPKVWR